MAVSISASVETEEGNVADRVNRTPFASDGCGSLARFFLRLGAMVLDRYRR